MSKMQIQLQPAASGIIIYKREGENILFLGLVALEKFQIKNKGLYDIPKGRIDPGETALEAAYRECEEEAGLRPASLLAGPFIKERMCLWVAEVDSNPKLTPNPETGEHEHLGYAWVQPNRMINNCLDYLKPYIIWAHEEICQRH